MRLLILLLLVGCGREPDPRRDRCWLVKLQPETYQCDYPDTQETCLITYTPTDYDWHCVDWD